MRQKQLAKQQERQREMVEEQARIRLAEASLETERIRTNYLRDQYRKDRFDMMQNADWLKKERQIEDHMNK
jgi:hypothetical protein